jgi:hypothetical protein
MARARFYDATPLPIGGGYFAHPTATADGGVAITVRDAKDRRVYGSGKWRDGPADLLPQVSAEDAAALARNWRTAAGGGSAADRQTRG